MIEYFNLIAEINNETNSRPYRSLNSHLIKLNVKYILITFKYTHAKKNGLKI